jgi:superfamily II DNA helicase RecQ
MRAAPLQLLISDGIVEEFSGRIQPPTRMKKSNAAQKSAPQRSAGAKTALAAAPVVLNAEGERLAGRIREWRAAEAKRLRVPAFVVMHDRTVAALAQARPRNPNELLRVDGIGPAKAERFGEELLRLCAGN